MAFCKYCGKELKENEKCDCERAVAAANKPAKSNGGAKKKASTETKPAAVTEESKEVETKTEAVGENKEISNVTEPVEANAEAVETKAEAPVEEANVKKAKPEVSAAEKNSGIAEAVGSSSEAGVKAPTKPVVSDETIAKAKDMANGILSSILKVVKNPLDGTKEYTAQGTYLTSGIIIGIQALFSAVFASVIFARFKAMSAGLFFGDLLLSILILGIYSLLVFAMFKVFKMKEGFKEALNLIAVRSIVITAVTVVACIFGLFAIPFASFLLICSVAVGFIFVASFFVDNIQVDHSKLVYSLVALAVAMLISYTLIGYCGKDIFADSLATGISNTIYGKLF